MIPKELVVDKEVFAMVAKEGETIINTRKRLPDCVFQRSFAKYYAVEYGYVSRAEFCIFLAKIAATFQDDVVHYITIDPDPVTYYYRHSGFFGLASFKPEMLPERYLAVMTRDKSADSFLYRGGDVGAFWGSSLKWAVSCDRISWEMAVIAVAEDIDIPSLAGFRCMDESWLSDYMESQYPRDTSVASEFMRKFVANYPI